MPESPERVGIVGLGVIGGSLALALRDTANVVAWSRDGSDREAARRAGIATCASEAHWTSDFAEAGMIVIAVPIDEIASVLQMLLGCVPNDCLLLHVGGLQGQAALGLTDDQHRRVIGIHPIAGSERSGFAAANAAMFRGATLRAESRATMAERARIEWMWRSVGGRRLEWEDATAHDELMAWVSHLPQLTATALSATLAQRAIRSSALGPGGRDATRLAASDLTMWKPVLDRAPGETAAAVERLIRTLQALREALETRDAQAVATLWEQARAWKLAEDSTV